MVFLTTLVLSLVHKDEWEKKDEHEEVFIIHITLNLVHLGNKVQRERDVEHDVEVDVIWGQFLVFVAAGREVKKVEMLAHLLLL